MQTNNPTAGLFKRSIRLALIIGFVCAAMMGCAYFMHRTWGGKGSSNHSSPLTPSILNHETSDRAERPLSSYVQTSTMEIIHDDVVTRSAPSKARQLYLELQSNPNFQKALENPEARANIERMLNHPEIEKKLNGWFASLVRSAIHARVSEPDFPEAIANTKYVDDLFKQHGIA